MGPAVSSCQQKGKGHGRRSGTVVMVMGSLYEQGPAPRPLPLPSAIWRWQHGNGACVCVCSRGRQMDVRQRWQEWLPESPQRHPPRRRGRRRRSGGQSHRCCCCCLLLRPRCPRSANPTLAGIVAELECPLGRCPPPRTYEARAKMVPTSRARRRAEDCNVPQWPTTVHGRNPTYKHNRGFSV